MAPGPGALWTGAERLDLEEQEPRLLPGLQGKQLGQWWGGGAAAKIQ